MNLFIRPSIERGVGNSDYYYDRKILTKIFNLTGCTSISQM
jgi:hypothetical protein